MGILKIFVFSWISFLIGVLSWKSSPLFFSYFRFLEASVFSYKHSFDTLFTHVK